MQLNSEMSGVNPSMDNRRTVGWVAYETIRNQGIGHAFCVPGESYLSLLDAFHGSEEVTLVSARHEEGAGLIAEAYAKATGKPGGAARDQGARHHTRLDRARYGSTRLDAPCGLRGPGADEDPLPRGMGTLGARVTTEDELPATFADALGADRSAVIDIGMAEDLLSTWDGSDIDAIVEAS